MISKVSTWARQRRVATGGEIADAYFRLAIPEWGIGHAEMKAILVLARDPDEFDKKLVALSTQIRPDGMTRVRAFLDQLEDYTDQEIPEEHIPSFVQALFRVGDKLLLPEDEARNLLDSGNDIRIGRIIYRLLRRLEEPERFEMLRHAIEASDFLAVTALALTIFDQEHKRHLEQPDAWRSVNAEHLGILQDLALRKIRAAAENGTLVRSKRLGMVLFRWQDWAGPEEVRQWVLEITRTDGGLSDLLELLLGTASAIGAYDRLDPSVVSYFLNVPEVADRARKLTERADLTERQQAAVKEFIRVYDCIQEGKNPDDIEYMP